MAITSITTLAGLRSRIRFISGIKAEEIDDTDLDLVISIATEWFLEQTGIAYVVTTPMDAAYNNAVMYYSCYLGSIAQNGVGIEQIRIGDVFIQYDDNEPYNKYLEMANDAIMAKQGLSIQTTSYNASSSQGDVDWKKNIDGSDGTQNVRQKPRGM
jgi:hypothetical protein